MNSQLPSRLVRAVFLAGAVAAPLVFLHAQTADAPVRLPTVVVSATRTPQAPQDTSSSVTLVSLPALQTAQVPDLKTVLAATPGVVVVNSGAFGGQSSIFLRGANDSETLFVVDGVRMNDRSATYLNFLGGADLTGLDRVEILRGPQSTLYGSSAMGGVILLDTAHGSGSPSGVASVFGGSFDTSGASGAVQGGAGTVDYSASLAHEQTQNKRPLNNYNQWTYSTRLEDWVAPEFLVGTTFRGQRGRYQEPGSTLFVSPGNVNADNYLLTTYGEWRPEKDFNSRVTLGWHQRLYQFSDAFSKSDLRNTREILDWQNTWEATKDLELVAGVNAERSYYTVDGVRTYDNLRAGYLSATEHPVKDVTITAGVRNDHYRSVGGATTWHAGTSWWLPESGTKLRATYGTGFNAPGSDDRYGVPEFGQLPSPNLQPEKSRGWDAGVDQNLLGNRLIASATYFQNRFRDMFSYQIQDFTTFAGRTVNVARATTKGVEFGLEAHPVAAVTVHTSYTYLDATNDITGARLTRRPRHTGDASVQVQATSAWIIGAGVHFVADRQNSGVSIEDYTTVRAYMSYELTKNLLVKVRIENALNEQYSEVPGYPALPRAVYGGVDYRF